VISAPNGIAIGGGTVSNPTVNNFAPPARTLSTQQVQELGAYIRTLPDDLSSLLWIRQINETESKRFAAQIAELFESAGKKLGALQTVLDWPAIGESLYILVHDEKDPAFKMGLDLTNAFLAGGTMKVEFQGAEWVKPGMVCIYVFGRPLT
jgi:hypothetical protein